MIKEKLKYGSVYFKIYIFFKLIFKEKYFIPRKTYSQHGEDLFVEKFFKNKKKGTYVDLGAFHPLRHNNTHKLYCKGWVGTNIDLNPYSIDLFNFIRKKDKNILAALAPKKYKTKVYFDSYFSTLNTIDLNHKNIHHKIKKNKKNFTITTKTFNEIINKKFDFLNIDIEGMDFNVLKTINLEKYSPKLICIEILKDKDLKLIEKYFLKRNYKFIGKRQVSYFFSN